MKRGFIDEKVADAALEQAALGVSPKDALALSPGKKAALEESVAKLAFTCSRCGKRDLRAPEDPVTDTCDECRASSHAADAPAWMKRNFSEAVKKVTSERQAVVLDEDA